MAEHLLEMAKALVLIRDGEIKVLSDPMIRSCPLRKDLYGFEEETRETVEKVLRKHMSELGMYGPGRVLETEEQPCSSQKSDLSYTACTRTGCGTRWGHPSLTTRWSEMPKERYALPG